MEILVKNDNPTAKGFYEKYFSVVAVRFCCTDLKNYILESGLIKINDYGPFEVTVTYKDKADAIRFCPFCGEPIMHKEELLKLKI